MTVKQILDTLRLILKDKNRPALAKEEYNALLTLVNEDMFWREFNKGGGVKENVSNNKSLDPFKTSVSLVMLAGEVALPANYVYCLGANTVESTNRREIDIISEIELSKRFANKAGKQIKDFPVGIINDGRLKVFPTNLTPVRFYYLRKPIAPVYATVLNSEKLLYVYDSNGSTQLEWNIDMHPEFIRNILNYLGVQVSLDGVNSYIKPE
jgi:hypothetical protein